VEQNAAKSAGKRLNALEMGKIAVESGGELWKAMKG